MFSDLAELELSLDLDLLTDDKRSDAASQSSGDYITSGDSRPQSASPVPPLAGSLFAATQQSYEPFDHLRLGAPLESLRQQSPPSPLHTRILRGPSRQIRPVAFAGSTPGASSSDPQRYSSSSLDHRNAPRYRLAKAAHVRPIKLARHELSPTRPFVPPDPMADIRPLITQNALKGSVPARLFAHLRLFKADLSPHDQRFIPDALQLKEIVIALKNYAPEAYLRNMADDERYVATIAKWLRAFWKEPEIWEPAVAPTLLVSAYPATALGVRCIHSGPIAHL